MPFTRLARGIVLTYFFPPGFSSGASSPEHGDHALRAAEPLARETGTSDTSSRDRILSIVHDHDRARVQLFEHNRRGDVIRNIGQFEMAYPHAVRAVLDRELSE
jgi:hypothetical protein